MDGESLSTNSIFFAFSRQAPSTPPSCILSTAMLRTPLATISGNRPRNKELSPFQRGFLVGQATQGRSYGGIAKAAKLPKSTVQTAVSNASLQQNGESRPRSGRPRATTPADQRLIIRTA